MEMVIVIIHLIIMATMIIITILTHLIIMDIIQIHTVIIITIILTHLTAILIMAEDTIQIIILPMLTTQTRTQILETVIMGIVIHLTVTEEDFRKVTLHVIRTLVDTNKYRLIKTSRYYREVFISLLVEVSRLLLFQY